ncbi:hypothetical protein ALC57_11960 [Trachymyrmex cornetzi]|uniref:GIY-YIG domain-containing protein n=1 Tax=Trachymyrmex cornetzi TaxID=471704 RepID=A0A151J1P9_9HYME|nr:hypothetical protein ALC57_11960 [Trachymyrmex cornetzi]
MIECTLTTFNSLHPRLQFTLEIGGNSINFLDLTIINNNGMIELDWYHKPTFSGRYLNYFSAHPTSQKKGIIMGMLDRVMLLSDPKFRYKNIKFIINTLLNNDVLPKFDNKNVLYKLFCKDCDATYVGQTYRKLSTRISEHRRHINWNTNSHSVITDHRIEFSHDFDWENVRIFDKEKFLKKRLISEMAFIQMQNNGLNLRSDTEGLHYTYAAMLESFS